MFSTLILSIMTGISGIIENASAELTKKEGSYLKIRSKSEEAVRICGRAMQLAHAGKTAESKKMLDDIKPTINGFSKLDHSCVQVAQQEYTEALILLHMLEGTPIPDYKSLNIPPDAYLLGLSDALGELRREIIEHMRKDDYKKATILFEGMSEAYELLLPLRFSNSTLPGFRRKLDVARSLVEQCRRDLLMFKISKGL